MSETVAALGWRTVSVMSPIVSDCSLGPGIPTSIYFSTLSVYVSFAQGFLLLEGHLAALGTKTSELGSWAVVSVLTIRFP